MEKIKSFIKVILGWISPVYVTLLVAAFILWYITKLGEEYTTDHTVTVVINGEEHEVDCTIHGKGTDLIHYTISSERSDFNIPLTELTQDKPMVDNDGNTFVHITAESLKNALAQRMDNIEIRSVGSVTIITERNETPVPSEEVTTEAKVVEEPEAKVETTPKTDVEEKPETDAEVEEETLPHVEMTDTLVV